MIEPTTDAARVNAVLNHPDVRPWIADLGEGEIDTAPLLDKSGTLCLMGEHGLFFLFKYDIGIWEVHTAIRPSGRGAWAREFAERGARHMFCTTDCVELLTRVPEGHIAAKALTETMGFRWQFDTLAECKFRGQLVPAHIYSLTYQEWGVRAHGVEEDGARFHAWLNRQVAGGHPHPEDPGHNRIVGIAWAMIESGQVRKGVVFYNKCALAARHRTIALLSENPVQIRFDAGVLTLENGEMRYAPCQ
jgi:hypothetical protein